jgi:hypothetical protein
MKTYRATITVDEEQVVKAVTEHDQESSSVAGAIEHEFAWLEQSGITLYNLEEADEPEETYLERLAEMHAVDIKREFIIPAIEQIIEDYEDASQLTTNTNEEQREAVANQSYWIAILDLVNKA